MTQIDDYQDVTAATFAIRQWRRYPDYRDSGITWLVQVPAHWEIKALKYACHKSAIYGLNEAASSYVEQGIRFIRTTDIDDFGHLKKDGAVYLDPLIIPADAILQDGDLLLSRSGTIGRSFVTTQEGLGERREDDLTGKQRTETVPESQSLLA